MCVISSGNGLDSPAAHKAAIGSFPHQKKTSLLIPEHFLCEGMLQHSSPAVAVAWNKHGSRSELPPRKAKLLKQILTKLFIVTGGAEINLSFQGNQVKKV